MSYHMIEALTEWFFEQGFPMYIRSDNGPEFITKRL